MLDYSEDELDSDISMDTMDFDFGDSDGNSGKMVLVEDNLDNVSGADRKGANSDSTTPQGCSKTKKRKATDGTDGHGDFSPTGSNDGRNAEGEDEENYKVNCDLGQII